MSTSKHPGGDESGYHHGNLREALVQQGLALLAEGHADFSLRELTRQVGVSANAAYRHFASKEALLSAMAAEGFRQLSAAQAVAVQAGSSTAAGFLEAGRAYVRFARQHPALFRLMFGRFTVSQPDEELKASAQLAFAGLRHAVAAVLALPVEAPEVLTAALHAWSLVHGLSQLIIDGQLDAHAPDIEDMVDAILRQAASTRP